MPHICSVLPYSFCEEVVDVANSTSLHGKIPLPMDKAYLTLVSAVDIPLTIYENHDMCESCKPVKRGTVEAMKNYTFVVGTDTSRIISLGYEDKIECRQKQYFIEYGDYYIHATNVSGNVECSKAKLLQTVPYTAKAWQLPLNYIVIFCLLLLLAFTPTIIKFFLPSRLKNKKQNQDDDYVKTEKLLKPNERLISLDVFRGVTTILTIFGNAGFGGIPYFYHNVWHGMNIAELPHGWFNWMLGISFSIIVSRERRNLPIIDRMEKVFRRASIFVFFGLVVNSTIYTSSATNIPYFGVLQGMGILTLFVHCMDLIIPRKRGFFKNRFFNFLDVSTLWPHYLIIFLAAIIHNGVLFGLDVPGCGRGYLGPGGLHMYGKYKNCTGGASGYIDRLIVGQTRMPHSLPFSWYYGATTRHDPYGPFGLIGQLVQMYLGVLAGEILLLHKTRLNDMCKRWFCIAGFLSLLSWLLCNDTFDYCILPCNRRLWTLTHSCNVGSSALILFSALYLMIDVTQIWNGWPIYYLGRNSLFAYVGHILTMSAFPFSWPTPQRHSYLFFQHVYHCVWWVIICGYLYHKKYFFVA